MSELRLLYQGQQFVIAAFSEDDEISEVERFLNDRKVLSESDEAALQDLFVRHGDHGPVRNSTKCRFLSGGLWEYKAHHGGRIAWFYDEGRIVICACGAIKKSQKADPDFLRRAATIRERYFREKQNEKIIRRF